MGKRRKGVTEVLDVPIDLASRIGMAGRPETPAPAAPQPVRRVDGPIEPDRPARGRSLVGGNESPARPLLIGANEPPARPLLIGANEPPARPVAPAVTSRPTTIGLEQASSSASIAQTIEEPAAEPARAAGSSGREAPSAGEMDLVVTPLATPDDWHHFELALRRLPGVGPLRTEYYRAGILKLRLRWAGPERLAYALAGVPGYRVGILGEDRNTVQIRVVRN